MAELNTNLPPWMQDRSFWASDPNAGSGFKFGMQLGMQNAQQQAQLKQRAKAIAFEQAATALKLQAQEDMIKGQLELSAVMADGARNNLYTDPKWEATFWETVSKHPRLMSDSESFGRLTTTIENAKKAKQQFDEIRLRHQLPDATADVKNIEQLTTWKAQMRDAVQAGEFDTAEELHQQVLALETQMTPANTTVESFGPEGQVISRITTGKGGTAGQAGLTTAVQSDLQKRMIGFEKINGMSKRLLEALGPLDVGIAGWGQQVIVNEGLAQFFPGLASQSTTDARSLLGTFNEQMIKTLKADAQVNQKEEQRILAVLPKPGPNESLPSATSKIIRAMREIHSMSAVDAQKLGAPAPVFPLSADDIRGLWKAGKLQDRALAEELLRTYHGYK